MLALLVVLSLILISASFGSSGGGPLHTVQSGFLDVLSPIETGASKALTPVHDVFKWFSDVSNAASQRDAYRKRVAQLQTELAALTAHQHASSDAAKLQGIDAALGLAGDGPVNATVIGQPQNLWVSEVTIDVGRGDGVKVNDPVIDRDGLIGTVTQVAAISSVVTLINDSSAREGARDSLSREIGVIEPLPGSPGQLQLSLVSHPSEIKVGDLIVTAGERATQNASLFPANVPIGQVTAVPAAADPTGTITVSPAADLTSLENVQVLTRVPGA